MTRTEAVQLFRSLHRPGEPLVMPNPWDLGSAKLMIRSGAKAIATTSSGFAFTLGHPDSGYLTRDQSLEHAAAIAALGVPVNGDFENCYGHDPETVAETVRLAAEAGLAGVSVEDTVIPGEGSYPFEQALDRVRAAVEAAREVDIVLTARADGVLQRAYDEAEAIRRCRAFAEAGAEVIYAPIVSEATNRDAGDTGSGRERADGGADGDPLGPRDRGDGRGAHLHRRGAGAGDAPGDPGRDGRAFGSGRPDGAAGRREFARDRRDAGRVGGAGIGALSSARRAAARAARSECDVLVAD